MVFICKTAPHIFSCKTVKIFKKINVLPHSDICEVLLVCLRAYVYMLLMLIINLCGLIETFVHDQNDEWYPSKQCYRLLLTEDSIRTKLDHCVSAFWFSYYFYSYVYAERYSENWWCWQIIFDYLLWICTIALVRHRNDNNYNHKNTPDTLSCQATWK